MDIKKRRRRRVATLILITLMILGGLTAMIVLQRTKQHREAQAHRAAGIAALEAKDYGQAVARLKDYLVYEPADAEAQYAYALGVLEVPQPGEGHYGEAIGVLKRVIHLEPDHRDAAHRLLKVYRVGGGNEQILELTEQLLKRDAGDSTALRERAFALLMLNRLTEAREAAERAVQIKPDDFLAHLILTEIMRLSDESKENLVAYAAQQAAKHPEDPGFELLAGRTFFFAGAEHADAARQWLRQAGSRSLTDPEIVIELVRMMDAAQMWDESLEVLRQGAAMGDATLTTEYARRLFESDRYGELVERFAVDDPSSPRANLEQQVLRVMSLQNLQRRDEAKSLNTALGKRKDTPLAQMWSSVLSVVYDPQTTVPARIEALQEAMTGIVRNPYLNAMLGDAYMTRGDREKAIRHWQQAADLRPTWGNMSLLLARVLLDANRPKDAHRYATVAVTRMPTYLPAIVTMLRCRAEAMGSIEGDSPQQVLGLADRFLEAVPGEPETQIIRADMLGRLNRKEDARQAAVGVLNRQGGLPPALLLRLEEVSQRHGLQLEERIGERKAEQMEGTPELAFSRASQHARRGEVKEGLTILDEGLVAAPPEQKLGWELARAAYLDTVDDPSAASVWAVLADNHPSDRRVQQMALRARAVQADRAVTARILERLKTLMGEDSTSWQVEQARWLASSGKEGDATQAVALLRQLIKQAPTRLDARLLLAQTLLSLNRPQLAIQELRVAEQAIPGSIEVSMELVRLYQAQREFPNAKTYLDRVLAAPSLDDAQRRDAAVLLARQGDVAQAMALMEKLIADDGGSQDERLHLASLYARAERHGEAERLLAGILKEDPSPQALGFALSFFSARQDEEEIRRVLGLIETTAMPEGVRQRLLGEQAAREGNLSEALQRFAAATELEPHDSELWRQRVRLQLMQPDARDAITVAQAGLTRLPDEPALKAVVDQGPLVLASAENPWARRVLVGVVEEPSFAPAGAAALQLLGANGQSGAGASEKAAAELSELAKQNPGFLPLQLLAVRKLLEARQIDAAVAVATRTSGAFPEALEPLAMQAEALAAAGRWADALAAAAAWRKRSDSAPLPADVVMAEAHLQLGQPERALQQLLPHLSASETELNRDVLTRVVRAQVALKRYPQAMQTLEPRLSESAAWRRFALDVASQQVQDEQVAASWVRMIENYIPASEVAERLSVAQAWWTLAGRVRNVALREETRRVVDEVIALPDPPGLAWYLRGLLAEDGKDGAGAIEAYREALQRSPGLPPAMNNLAMRLVETDGDVTEAMRLASAAVAAEPDSAAYLDTLAAVQVKAGQVDAGVETLEKAIAAEPNNRLWYDNLAKVLRDAGKAREADKVMERYELRVLRK